MTRRTFSLLLLQMGIASALELKLPLKPKSVRLALVGDTGTGEPHQFDVARQMVKARETFPFDSVLMMGDNIYGGQHSVDFRRKFEDPYRALLESSVNFYASLGNHDDPNQRLYKPFHMDGKRYYNFKLGNAEFFALDSNYMDRTQLDWVEKQLSGSSAAWKICYFHHPLYSHGRDHGPDTDLRRQLEPLFLKNGVNLVLSGHEHSYERLKPQQGISYFVLGNSGQLRPNNLRPHQDTDKGFDTDQAFGLVEIAGDELYFQVISRIGETVDFGVLKNGKEKAQLPLPLTAPARRDTAFL
ncbi:MAG TPA: metallophosphoesterase [Bryobacteraceae bacterium]|nr:metallophosphoesterase [Bryobacteraceae bacterium]